MVLKPNRSFLPFVQGNTYKPLNFPVKCLARVIIWTCRACKTFQNHSVWRMLYKIIGFFLRCLKVSFFSVTAAAFVKWTTVISKGVRKCKLSPSICKLDYTMLKKKKAWMTLSTCSTNGELIIYVPGNMYSFRDIRIFIGLN